MKMFILGLDGASFRLVNEFIEKGKMPVLEGIIKNGCYGKLISTVPPHTAPGWVSAFTGVSPGEHGVYQFWDTQAPNYVGKFMGLKDFHVPPVWNILNMNGIKTGLVNIPMTHPPVKLDGFMITWPLSNTLRYAYPEDILIKLAEYGGHYASDLSVMYDGNLDYIDKAISITQKRVKSIEYLVRNCEWDILISVFTEIDRVCHFYWHFMDPKSRYYEIGASEKLKKAVENIYCETDKAFGKILELLPKDVTVMVISDHGFDVGDINLYVQSFLMDKSLLGIKKASDSADILDKVKNSWFECELEGERYIVDWSKTIAYMAAPGSYGINVNLKGRQQCGIVEQCDYESVRDNLISIFEKVTHPYDHSKLFKKVARREDVYKGRSLSMAPDIILIPESYSTMAHHSLKPGQIFGIPEHKGMHDSDGIFAIYREQLNCKDMPSSACIEDVAATILNYYGISKPEYMEGKSIIQFENTSLRSPEMGVFCADKYTLVSDVGDDYTDDERREAEKKLKSLGYL